MNRELLKRIEKLEYEVQDLTKRYNHITTAILSLISKIDPEGFERALNDVDNNVS